VGAFIQPCRLTSRGVREHYVTTVLNSVDSSMLMDGFRGRDVDAVVRLSGDGGVRLWGVVPGPRNGAQFRNVADGDLGLFAGDKMVHGSFRVLHKFQRPNEALARHLWGSQDDGKTWSLMYAISDLAPTAISATRLREALGYKVGWVPQGFMHFSGPKAWTLEQLVDNPTREASQKRRKLFSSVGLTASSEPTSDRVVSDSAAMTPRDRVDQLERENVIAALAGLRKLDWTWEEQLLAFRLARGGNPSSSKDPRVLELSQQLRQLDIHPVAGRPDNFRSPNSVRDKCGDIISHAPGYAGQTKSGSRLDTEVWARFGDFTDEQLDDVAELILAGLRPFDAPGFDSSSDVGTSTGPHEVTIKGGFTEGSGRRRRGQQAFRKRLLDIVGPICLITGDGGSTPDTVLDAAHLYSFAKTGEHLPQGGTLMRKDVHALFDADLIAVDPNNWTVWVSPALDAFDAYSFLRGKTACQAWRPHLDGKLLADRLATAHAKASRL